MSTLNLEDLEPVIDHGAWLLRCPMNGEAWVDSQGRLGHDGRPFLAFILRRKPEPVHDGHWAVEQMLAKKIVECPDAGGLVKMRFSDHLFEQKNRNKNWAPTAYIHHREFWYRDDWRIYEEPKSETPVADAMNKHLNVDLYDVDKIRTLANAISALESQIAELRKRLEANRA